MVRHTNLTDVNNAAIKQAAQQLAEGGLVAFPTETVYGLGANALSPSAVAGIYAAKQRPANHPVIVHVAEGANINFWAENITPHAQALIKAFWPGPLTLIMQRASHIPSAVSGGQSTIGLRCPSHPVAQQLLQEFAKLSPGGNAGVAAPSANKFGQVSPTQASHVRSEFPDLTSNDLMVLDGGASEVGIESTIVDVSDPNAAPVILRPGHILPEQIEAVLGVKLGVAGGAKPRVSGSLKAHYAPATPVYLVKGSQINQLLQKLHNKGRVALLAYNHVLPDHNTNIDFYACPVTPQAYAHSLYSTLRQLDQSNYTAIVIEQPPESTGWQAVNDRLSRAAAAHQAL